MCECERKPLGCQKGNQSVTSGETKTVKEPVEIKQNNQRKEEKENAER